MLHYPRTELAKRLADELAGKTLLGGDAQNGVFLAAPRRTGKSTFLKEDLRPELERRGVHVIYMDFWSDVQRDPGEFLADAIARALEPHLGTLPRLARKAGISSITLKGLQFDLARIGQPKGVPIPEALKAFQTAIKGPVALILDEAQETLSSAAGLVAMKALKSARDQMNTTDTVNLMLILSGSDRDKLMRLVHSKAAPFFGSSITPMPLLGSEFVRHLAGLIEREHPRLKPLDSEKFEEAFRRFGHRPQIFMDALKDAVSPFAGEKQRGTVERAVLAKAQEYGAARYQEMESSYLRLKPLEQAVLWRMLDQGEAFTPYSGASRAFYAKTVGRRQISIPQAQKAIEGLRNQEPPLVWKAANGSYAVEEPDVREWYRQCVKAGEWPPAQPA